MKNKDKYYDILYRYFEGELSKPEEEQLLKDIETNKDLRSSYMAFLEVDKNINNEKLINFMDASNEIREEMKNEKKRIKKLWWVVSTSAAIIALLVSSIFILKPFDNKNIEKELYAKHYTFNSSKEITRSSIKFDEELLKGLKEYDKHNYSVSIEILKKILDIEPQNVPARFYLAMSYIETEKYELAISNLEIIQNSIEDILIDQINWYLALCYLQTDKEKAINKFKELSESEYYCKEKSLIIYKKLIESN